MLKCIDLHMHSTFSDGTMTPNQLVELAKYKKLSAIALTDHDTVDGIDQAISKGNEIGLEVVSGIELSSMYGQEVHILGLYIDHTEYRLKKVLKELQDQRKKRNIILVKKLNDIGMDITIDEIIEISHGKVAGRPHVAELMKKKGYVRSLDEAFTKYLGENGVAYTQRPQPLTPKEAIEIVINAKGVPILAHPGLLNKPPQETEKIILELKEIGIVGIEVFHSDHNKETTQFLKGLAKKHNLLTSGGSDYHGENKDVIQLGSGRGNLSINYTVLEKIKEYKDCL